MSRITTEDQVNEIWARAVELNLYADRTKDQWANEITIFEGWEDVERVADIIFSTLPSEVLEQAPTWEHIKTYEVDRRHHIEWAIGDFGFSDQYATCGHCYVAIDTQDYSGPRYWLDQTMGDLLCDDCIRTNDSFAEEYLAYCAKNLGDENQRLIANRNFCSPLDHGYVCINAASVTGDYARLYDDMCLDLGVTELNDIPQWHSWLNTANNNDLTRLYKAVQIIDPEIMVVAQYHKFYSSNYLYWVKFDDSKELPEDTTIRAAIMDYAMGQVIAKWHKLTLKDNGFVRK